MSNFTEITPSILENLSAIVGANNISTGESELNLHSHDQGFHTPHLPEVVVWAETAQQVADILKLANEYTIPVTAWGAGSSLEGNPIPVHGGILLSLVKMDAIVEVHADDFQVTVQSGKPHKDLNHDLARYGLFFPPDPGANATIGGMLANNAAGIRTVKYGASKDNVLSMQVALADGRLIRVGSRSIKQSAGYNLLQLFVGSEGTLGIITEATLKLAPVPQFRTTMVASFETVEDAVESVVAIRGSGIDVAALEFLDAMATNLLIRSGIDIQANPSLLMEVHNAHSEAMNADTAVVREICEEMNSASFISFSDPTKQHQLWEARHSAYETLVRNNPDTKFQVMDVAVPISKYPEIVAFGREQLDKYDIMAALIGHAGDGNIHLTIPYKDEAGLDNVKAINSAIVHKAIELGGTSTGEHGVGLGKKAYMQDEHGTALAVMRTLKQSLDPNNILNPSKVIPDA
ncbi:MAG: FAD-binding oxidoreductase [Phototrophicaceae bacterium]